MIDCKKPVAGNRGGFFTFSRPLQITATQSIAMSSGAD
jgi:hypothetical protein